MIRDIKNIVTTEGTETPVSHKIIKLYDTPFERLNLEDEFNHDAHLRMLAETYKRKGYLKVGDNFLKYQEIPQYKKLTCGKVTGINSFRVELVWYVINNTLLYFNTEEYSETVVKASDKQLAEAAKHNRSVFKQKDYIQCGEKNIIDMLLIIHLHNQTSLELHSKKAVESEEKQVVNFLIDNDEEIQTIINDFEASLENESSIQITDDLNSYINNNRFVCTRIPETDYFIVKILMPTI